MYRLEVRQASCSHKEYMQKKQHQLGPASSYINITSTKYLFFLLIFKISEQGPRSTGLRSVMWQQICLPDGTKEKEKL